MWYTAEYCLLANEPMISSLYILRFTTIESDNTIENSELSLTAFQQEYFNNFERLSVENTLQSQCYFYWDYPYIRTIYYRNIPIVCRV